LHMTNAVKAIQLNRVNDAYRFEFKGRLYVVRRTSAREWHVKLFGKAAILWDAKTRYECIQFIIDYSVNGKIDPTVYGEEEDY